MVDDSEIDLNLLSEALVVSRAAVPVWQALDATEAAIALGHILEANAVPTLLVSDYRLDGLTALELAEAIAVTAGSNLLGLIVLSSSLSQHQGAELLSGGADAVFEKPMDLDGYAALAAALLELGDRLAGSHLGIAH